MAVHSNKMGYTIIEVMVVMVVLSVLAMAAMPLMELTAKRTKERELRQSLMDIRHALDMYKNYSDTGHVAKGANMSGYPSTLVMLANGVPDLMQGGQMIYFLRRIPKDPFAPDNIKPEDSWGLRSYHSPPENPQSGSDVFDVYSLSKQVGMNGIAYHDW